GRHFLSMLDFSREEILAVLDTAHELKDVYGSHRRAARAEARGSAPLAGKTLAMIFQKPSLRTRVSFETGMTLLGGHAIYLAPTDISLGKRETTEDIAIVLARYVDIIMARVFGHNIVEDLANHSTVPVINGLSDHEHPCQALADLQTVLERRGRLAGLNFVFCGDGNNVAHSLMFAGALSGMNVTVVTPPGYEPKAQVLSESQKIGSSTGAKIKASNDLAGSVKGADVIYTDVWASMGQEAEAAERKRTFEDYRIDAETMKRADPQAVILHCLPAHYGDEIDYATSRLPNSAIFDQAENRLHAQKALMVHLAG
ncbi:MAG: ornithine carbamoyltransferase, partial [Chloroflexi bacterium]|nr:ornithine carbamoyltransferase [Chloroflexota bacterium]